MKTPRIRILSLILLAAAAGACSQGDKPSISGKDTGKGDALADSAATAAADLAGTTATTAPDPQDPCRLLESAEVEAVLGAPLIGPPYRTLNPNGDSAGVPQDNGNVCWYAGKDNRNLAVQAEWKDAGAIVAGIGGQLAKAEHASNGMLKLQDGTELVGDWDEAKLTGCCTLMAMQGDSMVEIDFAGSNATEAQAGELANKALARLTKPLPVSGQAGNAAAVKREKARYASSDPCALWSADDIERLLGGPMKGEPGRSDADCTITYTTPQGRDRLFVITATPRNGYRTYRSENASYAGAVSGINASNDGSVQLKRAQAIVGPWEAAENGPIQFNAVRHDASIALRQGGMTMDEIRKIVGHGFDKIEQGAGK